MLALPAKRWIDNYRSTRFNLLMTISVTTGKE
jgi:hypothetical protein